ncbi:MAG: LacI family DNA-binding transcriptional regulator [Rhizobiaceae bacterium]|nr:LacI family DNA-binding transcriptional regulator [Rhizobiaceae bacterium]
MVSQKQAIEEFLASGNSVKIADVAKLAGVSSTTVSRVLNGQNKLVSKSTYRRVERVIGALNYQPGALGRALRQGQSDLVALFMPDTQNPYYSAITDSIEVCLQQDGVSLVLCNTREQPLVQDAALQLVLSFRIRCIVMLGAVDSPGLRSAIGGSVPVLFINRAPPEGVVAPFIGIDNRAAGSDVAKHLHQKGLTRVGAIRGPLGSSASRLRFEGFRDSMADFGKPIEPNDTWLSELTIQAGYELAHEVLKDSDRPQAIFCANDLIAYGFYRRAEECGVKVPEELLLVGFDDNPLNRWLAPWLTSVSIPYERFGPVVRAMISGNEGDYAGPVLLDHRIVERMNTTIGDKR